MFIFKFCKSPYFVLVTSSLLCVAITVISMIYWSIFMGFLPIHPFGVPWKVSEFIYIIITGWIPCGVVGWVAGSWIYVLDKEKEFMKEVQEYGFPSEWKLGQKVFNYALMRYPVETNILRDTDLDPFFSDDEELVKDFVKEICIMNTFDRYKKCHTK